MSKDKFVFEWRVGDQAKHIPTGGLGWIVGPSDKNINETWKPHGKTKKRYKAEKLKWQQSRIKKGDCVEIICSNHDLEKGFRGIVDCIDRDGDLWIGTNCINVCRVKPCKPPKPEKPVLESENFRIEDGRLIYKDCNSDWGFVGDNGGGDHCYVPEIVDGNPHNGCGYASSDFLREIATLLDRSTAAKK